MVLMKTVAHLISIPIAFATLLASSSLTAASATNLRLFGQVGVSVHLSLYEFQRLLRTSLDEELELIVGKEESEGSSKPCLDCAPAMNQEQMPSSRPILSTKTLKRTNFRGSGSRSSTPTVADTVPSSPSLNSKSSSELIWTSLIDHAWGNSDFFCSEGREASMQHEACPFLVCSSSDIQNVESLFGPDNADDFIVHNNNRNCVVTQTTPTWARRFISNSDNQNNDIIVQPLLDIMKVHPGTIDIVTSSGWKVPFQDANDVPSPVHNASETIHNWERILTVHVVPGLAIHEESVMLDIVENIMKEIQQMSEVGWLMRQEEDYPQTGQLKPWQEEHLIEHSLVGVPSLSDMFSLTSTKKYQQDTSSSSSSTKNDRLEFWDTSLANGLESTHACASLFTTLYIRPRLASSSALYDKFDIILNPQDGPPSSDYESSSSNVDCVTSLIVGLGVHSRVMSVESNLPEYHGWSVANRLQNSEL